MKINLIFLVNSMFVLRFTKLFFVVFRSMIFDLRNVIFDLEQC